MQMKRRSLFLAVVAPALSLAQGKGKDKVRGNSGSGKPGPGNSINIVFSAADLSAIWDYYGANPNWIPPAARSLPPGLVKKLQRGKPLPPGWQKKMAGFPGDLDGRLGPLPGGYRRVIVDRWAFVIATATNTIMDIIDLVRN